MDRKNLEIALAYAERDRMLAVGKHILPSDFPEGVPVSAGGKLLPVEEAADVPEWLNAGQSIQPTVGGPVYRVHIGNRRVTLVSVEGREGFLAADTSVLARNWRPVR